MFYRLLVMGIGVATVLPAADVTVIDEIICKVNGDIITRNDYLTGRKQLEAQLRQQGLNGNRLQQAVDADQKDILREKIDSLLLVSRAKELNLNVDGEVTKRLAQIQREAKIPEPDKFQEFVREQTGQPYEDYKNDMKNQLLTERVIRQEIYSKIQFKHEDLQKYYDEHKDEFQRKERVFLREILVSTDGKDAAGVAAAEKKAKDLVARARKGEKFPELAVANSDSVSAQQGGEIGAFEKGTLKTEIEKAIWDQPRGFVTDPINIGNGFVIYKVDEHQKAGLAQFDDVQEEVTNKLFQPRAQPEMRKYLTELRKNAFLEIKPGYIDTGAAPGKDTSWADPAQIKPEVTTKEALLARTHHKHLLGVIPIPGTSTQKSGTSSSQ